MCSRIDYNMLLAGIIVGCPYQPGSQCSQYEVQNLRMMPKVQALRVIEVFPEEKKAQLIGRHSICLDALVSGIFKIKDGRVEMPDEYRLLF